jgi:uncharacterized protein (DUF433 family)
MPGRVVDPKNVMKDLRNGLDDEALMRKYRLTTDGLRNLYKELAHFGFMETPTHSRSGSLRINVRDFVADVKSGMSDSGLRRKFSLTTDSLQKIYDKLLETQAIKIDDIYRLESITGDSQIIRGIDRHTIDFEVSVMERGHANNRGFLHDISETGVGTVGIKTAPNDMLELIIFEDVLGQFRSFKLSGKCIWASRSEPNVSAGFHIVDITSEFVGEFKKLLHLAAKK